MIIDKLENSGIYKNLNERFLKAFEFLKETNLTELNTGKYPIEENDNVFALVQSYNTKPSSEAITESHFKYADIQFMVSGSEHIGVTTLTNQQPREKNEENDYAFYDTPTSLIKMEQEMFAVFFPDDLHMPGVMVETSSEVKKVVVKVRL